MATLILRLPADPSAGASCDVRYALDKGGDQPPEQGRAPISELPASERVVAVAPASKCSWHEARIPPGVRGAKRLRSAMEGAVEELLLDEPAALHLAPAGASSRGAMRVLACDRAWLAACLRALADAGRRPERVVPEFSPGPASAVAYVDEELGERLAVIDEASVACLPLSAESMPQGAALSCEPALASAAQAISPGADPPRMSGFAERMAEAAESPARLDALEFASSGWARSREAAKALCVGAAFAPAWRPARIGACAALAVACAHGAWLQWSTKAELERSAQQLRSIATETFPSIKLAIEPTVQMERAIRTLRSQAGAADASDLESILSALGPAASAASSISYRDGAATFRAKPDSAAASIAEAARAAGYHASASSDSATVSAASSMARPAKGVAP